MAKAYSDDLRRRILQAYEQREGSEADLARRFRVSLGYVKKVRQQLRRTGKMDRVPHQPGRKPKFSEPIRAQLRSWLQQQPDLTLVELQEQLRAQVGLQVSVPSLWVVLQKIGLRLKKVTPRARARHGSQPAAASSVPGKAPHDRAGEADFPGRKRGHDADDAIARTGCGGGANRRSYTPGALASAHHPRGSGPARPGWGHDGRGGHGWGCVPRLSRTRPLSSTAGRRRGGHGQLVGAQSGWSRRPDHGARGGTALLAALLARLQPHRAMLVKG